MGHLSCLGCCGHDKRQSWSPLGSPSSALNAVRQNYKTCPRCKKSCSNTGNCTHCGNYLYWVSLPSLPCLSLFNPKNKRTQAGHQVAAPPEGRWSKYRAKIALPLKRNKDDAGIEIRNIVRSCGHCNQPVNYADVCNRFCPECGWPLSLTSTSLDKYADVVRAGPHQQGRRRIRSMIFNRSSRARHWELSCIEERASEEALNDVQLEPQDQYPDISPLPMPSGSDMAFIARPIAFTDNTDDPRSRGEGSQQSSSGEYSGRTLLPHFDEEHGEAIRQAQEPPTFRTSWPLTSRGAQSSPQLPRHLGSHFSPHTTLAPDSEATEDLARDAHDCDPSTDGRPSAELEIFHTPKQASACDVRVVQSLIESLKIDPMAVAAAAVDLHNHHLHASMSMPPRHVSDSGSYAENVNQENILGLEGPPKAGDFEYERDGDCALDHHNTVRTFNSNGFLSPPPSPPKKRGLFGSAYYADEAQDVTVQDVTAALKAGFVPQGTAAVMFSERRPKRPSLETELALHRSHITESSDSCCAPSSTAVGCATWV